MSVQGILLTFAFADLDGILIAPVFLTLSAWALLVFSRRTTEARLGTPMFALTLAASLLPGLALGVADLSLEPVLTRDVSAVRRLVLAGPRDEPREVVVLTRNDRAGGDEVVRSDKVRAVIGREPRAVTISRTPILRQLTAIEVDGRRFAVAPTLDPRWNAALGVVGVVVAGWEFAWARRERWRWAT